MKFISLLLLLLAAPLMAETGYRYVHPDGTVEFSDSPIEGGEEIELREAPATEFSPVTPAPAKSLPQQKKSADKGHDGPQSISITSPTSNQTMRFDGNEVVVSVSLKEELQDGERVVITLDGTEVTSGTGTSFNIGQVYRGAHTVVAHIESTSGSRIASSQSITFHVLQRSIQHPGQQPKEIDPYQ